MNWKQFEEHARIHMSAYFGAQLIERKLPGVPKKFDLVSLDGDIVGDAKYLTLVGNTRIPPAKFMEIAGHVWLLEKTEATRRFLVFGNQRAVIDRWLDKYGVISTSVKFYFLDENGVVSNVSRR